MNKYLNKELLEVGIDEVARGCLAGPVCSAVVIWPKEIEEEYKYLEDQIKDSKKISRKKRKELREFIEFYAIDFSVAFISNTEIDRYNILNATYMAMHKALDNLNVIPEYLLVDGITFTPYYKDGELMEHTCIKGGDNKYISIASASILAKEYHDEYILNLCNENPFLKKYDWENNMCYGTQKHIDAIKENGITEYHRKTFGICKEYS